MEGVAKEILHLFFLIYIQDQILLYWIGRNITVGTEGVSTKRYVANTVMPNAKLAAKLRQKKYRRCNGLGFLEIYENLVALLNL
jgi:hypothetical protein